MLMSMREAPISIWKCCHGSKLLKCWFPVATKRFNSGPTRDGEAAIQRPDAKDRAQAAVLGGHEGTDIARHVDRIANQRQPRRMGYFPGPARGRDRRRLDRPEGLGDRPADQVHPPHQFKPFPHLVPLRPGQNAVEDAARIRQTDNHDIARVGNFVAEEHPHDAQPDLFHRLSLDDRIAAGVRHMRPKREKPFGFSLENAAMDQPGLRPVADFVASPGRTRNPITHVVVLGCLRDVGQGGIEQIIIQWRRIDQDESVEIRIDAVFEGQIHQHRAGKYDVQRVRRENGSKIAPLFIEQEQENFFGEPQHLKSSTTLSSVSVLQTGKTRRDGFPCRNPMASCINVIHFRVRTMWI